MKKIGKYEISEIKAIAECAGDTEAQEALCIHNTEDQFGDGDCVAFSYDLESWESEGDIEQSMANDYARFSLDFEIDEDGIYHV